MSDDRSVAVIGGGIAGTCAALAFAQRGARVTLYEHAPQIREFGAGLQITPNGARGLQALGIDLSAGLTAQAVAPHDGLTGRAIARFDLTQLSGPPYRFFHRGTLIGLLADACTRAGVDIRTGQQVLDATPDGAVVTAASPAHFDLVIGADGVHSIVRQRLAPSTPRFSGQVAWRGVIAGDHPRDARIWMLPGHHAVTYPLPDGQINIVAVAERKAWAPEGWSHPDAPENLRAAFCDAAPELAMMLGQIAQPMLWGLFLHPVAPVWRADRLVMIGDAAHPTLPFLAQGANLAIEDAVTLGVADDLAAWEAARILRTSRAIAAANRNAKNYHLRGPARALAHSGLGMIGRFAPARFLQSMDWLYGFDPSQASSSTQTGT
ncbi:FAD-dependent oxidoreductase [Ketogulonicigenium vulgare]|uniref:FAD-dependent oxidoreductase n=1 Tax=Ketogulonicigenium vulgare TaxID=92945 RepID=UPI002358DB85|nr:FAD-dependent oxidoreductase [Ketogulonicigenium vulgare]